MPQRDRLPVADPPSRRLRVAILGATGSVGRSTLDVLARHPDRFDLIGLSAHRRIDALVEACRRLPPHRVVVADEAAAREARRQLATLGLPVQVHSGPAALDALAAAEDVDAVMAAIVGVAGLSSCLAAARAGKRLLLANKEALVVGGALFMGAVAASGATLLPVDSEHSAIFQCLPEDRGRWPATIDHLLLTASGGPFRTRDPTTLHAATPAEAVAHPNWVMGPKISVDSATMMNKALEVIEARWLFDLAPAQVRVVIHPQSIVHSMVVCPDASVLAQLGTPDMRVPIAYGLSFPERIESGAARLDLTALRSLSFEAPDAHRYPGLQLAYDALAGPAGASAVLNAANEVAVQAFLAGRIRFDRIHGVNAGTMDRLAPDAGLGPEDGLQALLALDRQAREVADALVRRLS